MNKAALFALGIILTLVLGLGCAQPSATTPAASPAATPKPASSAVPALPQILTLTTNPSGTTSFAQTTALIGSLEKYTPMKVRVETYGADLDRFMSVKNGAIHVISVSSASPWMALCGVSTFAREGPQKIRQVWQGAGALNGPFVMASSPFKTPSDLKGKKVAYVVGNSSFNSVLGATLAFANLTWKDVIPVPFSSNPQACDGLAIGSCDVTGAGVTGAEVIALEKKSGVRRLQLPASDTAGWARIKERFGYMVPTKVTEPLGHLAAKDLPVEQFQYPGGLWTYDTVSSNIIYAVAKTMAEGYPEYKEANRNLATWSMQTVLKDLANIPFHEGSVRLFKEKGIWTAEMEKWQLQQLDSENKRAQEYAKMGKDAWATKYKAQIEGEPD